MNKVHIMNQPVQQSSTSELTFKHRRPSSLILYATELSSIQQEISRRMQSEQCCIFSLKGVSLPGFVRAPERTRTWDFTMPTEQAL